MELATIKPTPEMMANSNKKNDTHFHPVQTLISIRSVRKPSPVVGVENIYVQWIRQQLIFKRPCIKDTETAADKKILES